MTNVFSRLLAFPFAIALIITFTLGGFDFTGPKTIIVLVCVTALMLIYIFNEQLNKWWWKRNLPSLERPLKSWIAKYSNFYNTLDDITKETFEKRISTFNKIKNFTLKAERDYQLEEDVKTIIAHEFSRLTLHRSHYLYEGYDHIVVYNHPFGSPSIDTLHTLEVQQEDNVVILSKEQLINGFLNPETYVNIGLLSAIMVFVQLNPRLAYPEVASMKAEDIAAAHGVQLSVIKAATGVEWINRLDLLIFCYFMYPDRTESFSPERFEQLEKLFFSSKV